MLLSAKPKSYSIRSSLCDTIRPLFPVKFTLHTRVSCAQHKRNLSLSISPSSENTMQDFSAMQIYDSTRLFVRNSSSQFGSLAMNDPQKQQASSFKVASFWQTIFNLIASVRAHGTVCR